MEVSVAAGEVRRVIERLPDLVNADAGLSFRCRAMRLDFVLASGSDRFYVRTREGRMEPVARGSQILRSAVLAFVAEPGTWLAHWQPVPGPAEYDLFALVKDERMAIEGDMRVLMRHLQNLKDILAAPRAVYEEARARSGATATAAAVSAPAPAARIEPITGRYVHLEIGDRPHRVYFEEAGSGIPLVCLHTAGADGRQYRHLMTDEAVTASYRVLAFDMPWHGKSFPPVGWRGEEYRLTSEVYAEMVVAFCEGLALEGPVVMGCSIGGRMALYLAIHHPDRFRAIIGLEAADFQPRGWYDLDWLHQPDIHGGEAGAAIVSGLVGPRSPDEYRWETLWQYMQGGPGVFRGDLWFYRVEGDLREETRRIDGRRCPLYLLTGEYDFSCTPEDSRRTAAAIEGAEVTVMEGLGHFPMSEDPERFRGYLLPVLDEIAGRGGPDPG